MGILERRSPGAALPSDIRGKENNTISITYKQKPTRHQGESSGGVSNARISQSFTCALRSGRRCCGQCHVIGTTMKLAAEASQSAVLLFVAQPATAEMGDVVMAVHRAIAHLLHGHSEQSEQSTRELEALTRDLVVSARSEGSK